MLYFDWVGSIHKSYWRKCSYDEDKSRAQSKESICIEAGDVSEFRIRLCLSTIKTGQIKVCSHHFISDLLTSKRIKTPVIRKPESTKKIVTPIFPLAS